MDELRWGLLFIGLTLFVAIYLYTRHKSKITKRIRIPSFSGRQEPVIVDTTDAETEPAPPPAKELLGLVPPEDGDGSKIVAIRLMARHGPGFPGEKLILALREEGLRHGEFGIFHRMADEEDSKPLFSVASLTEPGSFDLTRIKSDAYPGVTLFFILSGVDEAIETFDDMLRTGRSLSSKLDGDLLDEHGNRLSIQRERYLREEVIQFQHRIPLTQ